MRFRSSAALVWLLSAAAMLTVTASSWAQAAGRQGDFKISNIRMRLRKAPQYSGASDSLGD